ncbi:MAG TPA: hypothetical protein VHP80_06185, partial [Candidatus Acidoferrum sp.]|nr:hypothetical protein [Candidatus Acidoferrum sp.]
HCPYITLGKALMHRRRFLRSLAASTLGAEACSALSLVPTLGGTGLSESDAVLASPPAFGDTVKVDVEGHTLLSQFEFAGVKWKAYEDLRTRDGVFTLISANGAVRVLSKNVEAVFSDVEPPYLGLSLDDIGVSGPDLLADKLLEGGDDPNPERVKSAVPPLESKITTRQGWGERLPWNTFVGTKECFDTMPVTPRGSTRTYHPEQHFPELSAKGVAERRFEGLIGGWMPAVRKVFPTGEASYVEVDVFGDVEAKDKFIVQTWHRTARVESGKITSVFYGYSYPAFPPSRVEPPAEDFFRALLIFANYWDKQLNDLSAMSLADGSWVDLSKHAFAKELMVRPGGVYPKYGAVDRDYYGPEYDGFQDIFTSAVYTNLEWGRFAAARAIIDNYFTDFVDETGNVNMRGPETAQYGLELLLLAKYFDYTKDSELLLKHRAKIEATAAILERLHDESLKLPPSEAGYGLIHGWSESDSALHPKPMTWWLPYYGNSAFAARGWKELSRVWMDLDRSNPSQGFAARASEWAKRSDRLRDTLIATMRKNVRAEMKPPYIGPYAGSPGLFRETFKKGEIPVQLWAHRPYSELLQADMLPDDLANVVVDCMRGYGATTLGVVANVGPAEPKSRAILGFISYGYAQMLLRLDRVEEYLLFLYSHRYHDHNRGSWTAGEVSGLEGDASLFCIPAQQTIPLMVRWMLVFEDSDDETLYLGKGLPREWVASGKKVAIDGAATRWGRVDFSLQTDRSAKKISATVKLRDERRAVPKELHVKLRLPKTNQLGAVSVNGKPGGIGGRHHDGVVITVGNERTFEILASYT